MTARPKKKGIRRRLARSPTYWPAPRWRKASQVPAPASRKRRLMCQGPTKSTMRWAGCHGGIVLDVEVLFPVEAARGVVRDEEKDGGDAQPVDVVAARRPLPENGAPHGATNVAGSRRCASVRWGGAAVRPPAAPPCSGLAWTLAPHVQDWPGPCVSPMFRADRDPSSVRAPVACRRARTRRR